MSGGEVAAVIGAVAAVIIAVGFLFALFSLTRTLQTLRLTVEELRRETMPLVSDMRVTVKHATGELERVDGILTTAESVGATVDSASRLFYLFFSNPVIKMLAVGSGTARAANRLRRR